MAIGAIRWQKVHGVEVLCNARKWFTRDENLRWVGAIFLHNNVQTNCVPNRPFVAELTHAAF